MMVEVCRVFVSGRGRGWWWWILAINCITPPRSCRNIRHNPVLAQRHNTLTHRYPHRISRTPFLCSWSSQGIDTLQMRREYKVINTQIESLAHNTNHRQYSMWHPANVSTLRSISGSGCGWMSLSCSLSISWHISDITDGLTEAELVTHSRVTPPLWCYHDTRALQVLG